MKTYIENYKDFGKLLFVENGDVKLGIPLNYGLRISYLTYKGSDNLFFEHPEEVKYLTTPQGWRIYGGHRLWLAPESDDCYYPDNKPISYEICEDKIILTQTTDPWLKINKVFEIYFEGDNVVKINHKVTNVDTITKTFAPWTITSMAYGGVQYIPLKDPSITFQPKYRLSMWHYTNLGDERIEYLKDGLKLTHKEGNGNFKIGVGHPHNYISYTNKGVVFEKVMDNLLDMPYPDGDVSYETYMCDHMVELETLSPLYEVKPNQTVSHTETWRLTKQ